MSHLNLQPNFVDPDAFYAELIALQVDLDDDAAQSLYSKLLLLLANHIGDMDVLREAFTVARAQHDNQ
ncbi:MAG: hypothetical protein CSA47_00045 [Gammaproteobacteria bacterium]|nr:MAG: hypothetical protein CSA47_00045 [Gammaproteobacteria bacterium]